MGRIYGAILEGIIREVLGSNLNKVLSDNFVGNIFKKSLDTPREIDKFLVDIKLKKNLVISEIR